VVALRRQLDRAIARVVERGRKAEQGAAAGRAAAAILVAFGDRLGQRASARGRTFLVRHVLREPVVFTDRFGLRYLLFPSDAVYESFLNDGYYERAEQSFCAGYVKPGMTVFDVGASHGYYTLLFAKLAGPEHVHAFEPEAGNFARLRMNLELNQFQGVHASRLAVVDEPREVELNVFPPELYGWHTLGKPMMEVDGKPVAPVDRQRVEGVTLDDYCREQGVERIDVLKLDVEGAELEALRGAERLLREGRIDCLLFEVSQAMVEGMSHDPAEIFDLVRGAGLAVHELSEDGALQPASGGPTRHFQNFVALG
jgi:FkbM family methyltransferase